MGHRACEKGEATDEYVGQGDQAMGSHVTAIFADRHSLHAALEQLVQAGFSREAISLVMSDRAREREFGAAPAEHSGLRSIRPPGILGSIASALTKLPAGAMGVSLFGTGLLAATIRRVLEGRGGQRLENVFVAAGLSQEEARFLCGGVRRGSLAVCVTATDDRAHLAGQLLALSGGKSLQAA
jgi:hypothetical protein